MGGRGTRSGRWIAGATTSLAAASGLLLCSQATVVQAASTAAGSAPLIGALSRPAHGSRGKLKLRLAGLPRGERGRVVLLGPAGAPGSKRPRHLSLGSVRKLQLPVGAYKMKVEKVAVRRRSGTVQRGAVAEPVRRALHARVKSGGVTSLRVRYGTIVNPGVRDVSGHVAKVLGSPLSPTEVVVHGGGRLQPGQVLSAEPSAQLPHGLLAKASAVHGAAGGQAVTLQAAGIYEVAPNMSFDIPLTTSEGAEISKLADCKAGAVKPSAQVSDFHLTGGWTTAHVLFADIKTGATVELHYRVSAGVKLTAREGLSCSLPLKEFGFQGMAGPIPVYGGIRPTASAEFGAAASLSAGGSVEVTTGTKIGVLPPQASPIVRFSSPRFEFGATTFVGLKASIGLDAELGIGAEDAANIHADLGNSLDFTAAPGKCSWDLSLGKLSATGEIGKFKISTPETHGLYHHNLWQAACGAPPAPAPAPPAPVVPPPSVPAAGPTLAYTGSSAGDALRGDFGFSDWSAATGQPVKVEETLPASLIGYRCVALVMNRSITPPQQQALSGYLQAGGTVLALGEHEGIGFDEVDATFNGLAASLGVGISLADDSFDQGEFVTDRIVPSPLTAGVTEIGDDWVSGLDLSGAALPLVETSEAPVPFIGYQPVGKGLFVMSGDSNVFTDNNQSSYEGQDNGRLVANICP